LRTYYESPEYENELQLGTFARVTIAGDDEGPRLIFSSGDQVFFDLAIPACEGLIMSYALSRSAKHAIRAAEREEADAPPVAAPPPAPIPPSPQRILPRAADRFRELPAARPAATWVGEFGRQPAA
jgi:hypothetical protein